MAGQSRRIGVLGTFGSLPFAGMAWMTCQFLVGLKRLGHQVFYAEATSSWPYNAETETATNDPRFTLGYLQRVLDGFGLGGQWAYRATYGGGQWHGPLQNAIADLLCSADAVLNLAGATLPDEIGVPCRLVHIGTDPVVQELRAANGDAKSRASLAAHSAFFTYGENIGTPGCDVPPYASPVHPMRQPIVLDFWTSGPPKRQCFTTVTNWDTTRDDVEYRGERYRWSKSEQFLRFVDLPSRAAAQFELGIGGGIAQARDDGLADHGWTILPAAEMSTDPWRYRNYIRDSAAEFTVAKDMNIRFRSGWFSERSACYLAAGRPVVTQDTGFGRILPTGEGLFAFNDMDEIVAAVDAIRSDYPRHSRAARAIADEYFAAEKVLSDVTARLGL
jgi:hypothetical protein